MLFLVFVLALTNGFQVFGPDKFKVLDFLAAHITMFIFLAFYPGDKIWFGMHFVAKLESIDVMIGRKEMNDLVEYEVHENGRIGELVAEVLVLGCQPSWFTNRFCPLSLFRNSLAYRSRRFNTNKTILYERCIQASVLPA